MLGQATAAEWPGRKQSLFATLLLSPQMLLLGLPLSYEEGWPEVPRGPSCFNRPHTCILANSPGTDHHHHPGSSYTTSDTSPTADRLDEGPGQGAWELSTDEPASPSRPSQSQVTGVTQRWAFRAQPAGPGLEELGLPGSLSGWDPGGAALHRAAGWALKGTDPVAHPPWAGKGGHYRVGSASSSQLHQPGKQTLTPSRSLLVCKMQRTVFQ